MRLSTRLNLFFLGGLAIVLIGFSSVLYLMASKYLHRQADERLDAALNTLTAAAEIGPDGVEWEPSERSLTFGRRTVAEELAWQIRDDRGRVLDGSSSGDEIGALGRPDAPPSLRAATRVDRSGRTWRVMSRRLTATVADGPRAADPDEPPNPGRRHRAIVIEASLSLDGVLAALRNLAMASTGLSAGIWTIAMIGGTRLCRRAVRPVSDMAGAARGIGGDSPDERLPVPETGDELEDLGRSFNALLDRLRESFERQRRFTGDASHQLRTPLTAMQGQVDLALRQERPIEEYRRVLELVQRKTHHLRRIVESLLFLARADAEALRPPLERTDLADWLIEHVRDGHDPRSADMDVVVETDAPATADVPPSLLGELVDNLLENACKYSEPGTPIVVRLRRSGPTLRLSVEDRGIGIDGAEIPRLFEPFYRSADVRRAGVPGLGLGLSVASRLAGAIGGRIEVESQPGEGSVFTIVIPASESVVVQGTTRGPCDASRQPMKST